jgi:hypothetical protein
VAIFATVLSSLRWAFFGGSENPDARTAPTPLDLNQNRSEE